MTASSDIPDLTSHEKRALIYIRQINQEKTSSQNAHLSELARRSDWDSRYISDATTKLENRGLVSKERDGQKVRPSLSGTGLRAADLLMSLNEVLDQQ